MTGPEKQKNRWDMGQRHGKGSQPASRKGNFMNFTIEIIKIHKNRLHLFFGTFCGQAFISNSTEDSGIHIVFDGHLFDIRYDAFI